MYNVAGNDKPTCSHLRVNFLLFNSFSRIPITYHTHAHILFELLQ